VSIAYERYQKQKEAYLKGDFATVKKLANEARQELEEKGFIKTNLFGWIEKEWLEKALQKGVIIKKGNDYIPVAIERKEDIIDGYRGRIPIVKGSKFTLDISGFSIFLEEYETYKAKKEKQQIIIDEEMRSLIEA